MAENNSWKPSRMLARYSSKARPSKPARPETSSRADESSGLAGAAASSASKRSASLPWTIGEEPSPEKLCDLGRNAPGHDNDDCSREEDGPRQETPRLKHITGQQKQHVDSRANAQPGHDGNFPPGRVWLGGAKPQAQPRHGFDARRSLDERRRRSQPMSSLRRCLPGIEMGLTVKRQDHVVHGVLDIRVLTRVHQLGAKKALEACSDLHQRPCRALEVYVAPRLDIAANQNGDGMFAQGLSIRPPETTRVQPAGYCASGCRAGDAAWNASSSAHAASIFCSRGHSAKSTLNRRALSI
jgi:hypothetical protein